MKTFWIFGPSSPAMEAFETEARALGYWDHDFGHAAVDDGRRVDRVTEANAHTATLVIVRHEDSILETADRVVLVGCDLVGRFDDAPPQVLVRITDLSDPAETVRELNCVPCG